MSDELKSTLDIVMEKYGMGSEPASLTDDQKAEIADIRKTYDAKIAETNILIKERDDRSREIVRLREQMESKIEAVKKGR